MTYEEMARELGVEKEAQNLQILASGFKGVAIRDFIETPQVFPGRMPEIKRRWIGKIQKGDVIYDGALASVSAFWIDENKILHFILQKSSYILYVGTRPGGLRKLEKDLVPLDHDCCLPLSFGATTLTADGFIILGLRSQRNDTSKGKIGSVPSGYLNPEKNRIHIELLGNQISFDSLIVEELREELGITAFTSQEYLALIQYEQPLVAMRLKVPFTKSELEKILQTGFEHSKFIFVQNSIEAITQAFKDYQFSPHALSTVICHCCM